MAVILEYTEKVTIFRCSECGGPVALAENFARRRLEDHQTWYCPVGHGQHFVSKSEAEELRDALAQAQELANAEVEKRKRAEGLLASVEARAELCRVCNRKVKNVNMQRHMARKHPEQTP